MDENEDSASRFEDPDEIARHPELSVERKRALLERWRRDLGEQGQEGPAANLWERIGRALEFLDTESGGREQTHERVLHGPGMAPDATPDGTGRER